MSLLLRSLLRWQRSPSCGLASSTRLLVLTREIAILETTGMKRTDGREMMVVLFFFFVLWCMFGFSWWMDSHDIVESELRRSLRFILSGPVIWLVVPVVIVTFIAEWIWERLR